MYQYIFKRLLDFLISLFLLPFFVTILIVVAPVIYLTDRGPIFYNAIRVGENFKKFKMYKLRTMRVNAPDIRNSDGSTFNSDNDPRVTKVGKVLRKTSIDELPQIVNVLKGDMSFIGPRPSTLAILNEHRDRTTSKRFTVKPGVTGYTQAFYRNSAQGVKRYENDAYYVDNLSLKMDIKVLIKTIETVLKKENIYSNIEK
ncbi:MAG: sugar transferase [Mangrovibacterium sp.]